VNEIEVHDLLAHQLPIGSSPARFKVIRAGRRFGKDGFAENVSLLGHGPVSGDVPRWRALVHGYDVVWLAPTIPQAAAMWKNEVEPRFRGKPGIDVNKVEKTVSILNPDGSSYATLWVRSAEAIHSIRGIGKKLGGVIINEAAWMDLETAWRDVIRPTLMDCGGWAIIMSTTNAGPDGFENEAGKRSPSFFNLLCLEIQQGLRGPDWQEFYGTAEDNPKIAPEEFKALVAEYPPDSPTLAQEVYAKLIAAGAGLAFPEWDEKVHTTTALPERMSGEWRWSAGMDWGYRAPGWFGLFATTEEYSICRWEYYFRETTPYQVGYTIGERIKAFPRPEWIALDSACWNVTDGGPTIAEQLQNGLQAACGRNTPPVISTAKGAGSPVAGKIMIHEALRFTKEHDGSVKQWNRPALQVHADCKNLIRTLPKLPLDEKDPERVDTNAEDHAFDGLRYWLMARKPEVEVDRYQPFSRDLSYGFDSEGRKVKPWNREEEMQPGGSRYKRAPVGAAKESFEW
jgi:hypothetical protein